MKPAASKEEQPKTLEAKSVKKNKKSKSKPHPHQIQGKKFTDVQDEDFEKEQR